MVVSVIFWLKWLWPFIAVEVFSWIQSKMEKMTNDAIVNINVYLLQKTVILSEMKKCSDY